MEISFFVVGDPVGQPRQRITVRFGHAHNYTPQKIKRDGLWVPNPIVVWKDTVERYAMRHRPRRPLGGALRVDFIFYFPRPMNHFGTGRNLGLLKDSAPVFSTTKPDRDNCDKAVLDVLTEMDFWHDDAQAADGRIQKKYGPILLSSGRRACGVLVRIRPCHVPAKTLF